MPLARNNNLNIWQNQEKEVNKRENFQSPKLLKKKNCEKMRKIPILFNIYAVHSSLCCKRKTIKMIHPNWPQYVN